MPGGQFRTVSDAEPSVAHGDAVELQVTADPPTTVRQPVWKAGGAGEQQKAR